MQLKNKVAIVTGGARGIGKAIVTAFCEEGAAVVLSDLDQEGGERTARELSQKGCAVSFVRTDVGREEEVRSMVEQTLARHGRVDILGNSAGVL